MAGRDFRKREAKKPKKDEKQASVLRPVVTNPEVKVVPKRRIAKEPEP